VELPTVRRAHTTSAASGRRLPKFVRVLILVLLGVILVDVASSFVYKTGQTPIVKVVSAPSANVNGAIVILPGYVMSGILAAKSLSPYLPRDDAVIGVDYGDRSVDVEGIYAAVEASLRGLSPRHVAFYGASLGGMVAAELAGRYSASQGHAPLELILDTAPRTADDVRRPNWLIGASCWYPGGVLSSLSWALASQFASPTPTAGSSAALETASRNYGRWVGTPALTSQACFIANNPSSSESSIQSASVFYLEAPDAAEHDPLIKTSDAVRSWHREFPSLVTLTVSGRQGSWHVPLVERPQETATAIIQCLNLDPPRKYSWVVERSSELV
jgi:pimeloyl-ACP methyl ester carboxylesterase